MAATPTTKNLVLLTDTKVAGLKAGSEGIEYRDEKVQGLRIRIGTTGKKTWMIRTRAGNKVVNRKIGTYPTMGVAAARTAAHKFLESLASADGSTEGIDRTFGQVAEAWIEKVAKPKHSSWKSQERRLAMYALPAWRDRKIIDIRRRDVRELLDGIEGEVLPNKVLAILKTVFRFALSRDWIEGSPVEGIEKPKVDAARDRVLAMDEIARIWKAAGRLGYPATEYLRVLMLTGQRRSEVASMRWESVDLDAATWTLEAADTKSTRAHLVPLSPTVVETLKSLPRFGPYVFTTDGRTHVSGFAKMKAKLDAFIEADGGEPMKPWRLHDLRRSAATHLVRLGVLEEVVGKVLNHASQGVTAKVYALHRYEPEKRSALDRWAAEVDRAVHGTEKQKVVKLRPAR